MSNPANTSIVIETVTIVPGTTDVNLTYSNGDGNVTETTGQGAATIAYTLSPALFAAGWSIVGAVVMPPVPAFYTKPATVQDVVDQTIGRALDLFGLDSGQQRWGE